MEKGSKGILVTGCGRSGTGYMAALLTAAGCPVGHEKDGPNGQVSWRLGASNREELAAWSPVVHLVRQPLRCISSCQTFQENTWKWIETVAPEIPFSDPLPVRCMKYWLHWNLRAGKVADFRVRLEDLYEGLGYTILTDEHVPVDTNSRRGEYTPITIDQLIAADPATFAAVNLLATSYGY